MALVLSTQGLVSGQFGSFTSGMALDGTKYYPAVAFLKLDGTLFDVTSLMPSSGGSVSLSGTLPSFAATPAFTISGTPTVNLGTIGTAATAAGVAAVNT